MSGVSTRSLTLKAGLCFMLFAASTARADEPPDDVERGGLLEPSGEHGVGDEFVEPEPLPAAPTTASSEATAQAPPRVHLPEADRAADQAAPADAPDDEAPETREDIRFEVRFGLSVPERGGYDEILDAYGYSGVLLAPAGAVALSGRVFDWLWLGGRFGVRGRSFGHRHLDSVSLGAGDLLATLTARFELGPLIELGLELAGGVGYLGIHHRDVVSDQLVPRFDAAALFGVKAGRHLVLGVRLGYSYFRWDGASRFGEMVDLGGPFLALAFEGRP